jgi:thiopeptide-type bacteriocin biosynthesis protein
VFAEIVHLPEGRVGNILCRPVLRDYEIPYLGRSGVADDRQIPVSDLRVSVEGDRVVLRSARLGVEVVPRLTTAHNYGWRSLGIYRFLCALQTQGVVPGLMWDWGPLAQLPFLPRVVSGKTVLARARWNVTGDDIAAFRDDNEVRRFAEVQVWRAKHDVPRFVALADGDNELLIDLDNVLCIDALAHQVKDRHVASLIEMFPGPDELCVSGAEGRFVHQMVIPFVSTTSTSRESAPQAVSSRPRRFPPGSEWLYVKLYGGTAAADHVLDVVAELAERAVASSATDRWFFIRYSDPEPHLRIRLRGDPHRLHAEVLPAIERLAFELVDAGRLWRVQFDTYEREVERYGGDAGIELAERLFHADSRAVVAIVRQLSGDVGADARWRVALRGVDMLFDDLGLDFERKRELARRYRDGYRAEFGVSSGFHDSMSQRFRTDRTHLEALLDDRRDGTSPELSASLDVLHQRSATLRPIAAELEQLRAAGRLRIDVAELALSYAHMHVNRVLRAAQRAHELVIYELLDRVYASKSGRAAAGAP